MEESIEITDVERMLRDYKQIYSAVNKRRSGEPPFPICNHDIIHSAIDYGIGTCESVKILVSENKIIHAGPVVRPFLELALHMMWCCTQNDGWSRLVKYYAAETKKAVEKEIEDIGAAPISDKAMQALDSIIGNSNTKVPNLENMLKEIASKQKNTNAIAMLDEMYALFFKGSLHQLSHANLCYLSFEQAGANDQYRLYRSTQRAAIWVINVSHKYANMTEEKMDSFVGVYVKGFRLE
jgi:uncharacterized protein DUF5677